MAIVESNTIILNAERYYGETLRSNGDLRTGACCSIDAVPKRHRVILKEIAPEVLERFYGCGSPIPPCLEGCTVLDLGCGTGRDVYLASRLVGPTGYVIGVDTTDEQLQVANRYLSAQTRRFGYGKPNVSFRKNRIEDLASAGIEDDSIDVVISNCVINLSPNKRRVFTEIFRVLKPGGELYFSDVFADRRLPAELLMDPVLHGECLAGAMYAEDFRRLLQSLGCPDARKVSSGPIAIDDEEIRLKIGLARFSSVTYRAFKLASLEDRCEDYGQVARYRGTIEDAPDSFALDDHHLFETGKPMLVCGNTASMLEETRYARHFEIVGDRTTHYGLFDCGSPAAQTDSGEKQGSCC